MKDWDDKLFHGLKWAFKFIVRFSEILALAVFFGAAARLSNSGLVYLLSLALYVCSIGYLAGGISYEVGKATGHLFPSNRLGLILKIAVALSFGLLGVFVGAEINSALDDLVKLEID